MDTASIPATNLEEKGCGCMVAPATKTSGRRVLAGCEEARGLWLSLLAARDELADAGPRPPRRLTRAFATAREAYHLHARAAHNGAAS